MMMIFLAPLILEKSKTTSKSGTPVLDNFGRDLTKYAMEDKLDPIVGRHKEIERVSQILKQKKKEQPYFSRRTWSWKISYCRRISFKNSSKKSF